MAKKKSAPATKKPAARTKAKPASNGKLTKKSPPARKKVAAEQPAFANGEIGHAAGDVWAALAKKPRQSLADLKKTVSAPADVVLMALGWLAREDKVLFTKSGRSVKVALKE